MTDEAPSAERRDVLAAVTATLGGVAGCTSAFGGGDQSDIVSILAAGSLNNALKNGLQPRVTSPLRIEARGSVRVARMVAEEQKSPDIVSIADTVLFDSPLHPEWFAEFATNSIVLAYNPETEGGQKLAAAGSDGWYRPLLDGSVALGRTDPNLDPLGYRTLFTLELATEHYGTDVDLRTHIPAKSQVYPEVQLISQFETGAIDAAFTYRNMAVERDYEFVDLPAPIDLSEPKYAEQYATVAYELPDGKSVSGDVISYGSTIRRESPAVVDVFENHVTGEYLTDFGFVVPSDYPRYTGNVPDTVTN